MKNMAIENQLRDQIAKYSTIPVVIYMPMLLQNHWILVVVDVRKFSITMYNSLLDTTKSFTKSACKKLASFLESSPYFTALLSTVSGRTFYPTELKLKYKTEKNLSQQQNTIDCGCTFYLSLHS